MSMRVVIVIIEWKKHNNVLVNYTDDDHNFINLDNYTLIYAPTTALFLIKATFALLLSPSVSSLILFNRKGVILAPSIFYWLHSSIALSIAYFIIILFASSSFGTGLAINNPFLNYKKSNCILIIYAAYSALSTLCEHS